MCPQSGTITSAAPAIPSAISRAFSGGVVKDLNERLAKASVLSFDQMRDVAEGIDKFA